MGAPTVYFGGGFAVTKRGSYEMRGRQMAAMRDEWSSEWADGCYPVDIFLMVKKQDSRARGGRRVVLDIVDPWPQKPHNAERGAVIKDARMAVRWFVGHFRRMQRVVPIHSYIFPNKRLRKALKKHVPHSRTIYHHYHPTIPVNPIREEMRVVGYWGNKDFLGEWLEKISVVCKKMKLQFVVNPDNIGDVDVMVAARGGVYNNFMNRSYKSNVKLANCYGSGTPCVMNPEEAYIETANSEVLFFTTERELAEGLEELRPVKTRRRVHEAHILSSNEYSVENIAKQYEEYFAEVREL